MRSLELRIPPPVVALLLALAMWAVSYVGQQFEYSALLRRLGALGFALLGVGIGVSGAIAFRRARTTINPSKPQSASSLVTSGVYRITRNPMYVGAALLLVAWAIFLAAAWSFVGPLLFVIYTSRFQIAPEERALTALFGETYSAYTARVRRWL